MREYILLLSLICTNSVIAQLGGGYAVLNIHYNSGHNNTQYELFSSFGRAFDYIVGLETKLSGSVITRRINESTPYSTISTDQYINQSIYVINKLNQTNPTAGQKLDMLILANEKYYHELKISGKHFIRWVFWPILQPILDIKTSTFNIKCSIRVYDPVLWAKNAIMCF